MSAEESVEQTQSRRHYEAIVENMADVAFMIDSDWKLEYANEAALAYAGVSLEEIRGSPIMGLTEQMVAEGEQPETFERALETVYANEADTDYPVTVELQLDLPDGIVTNEYRCSPYPTDEGTKAIVVARDVTERKERERELREAKERLDLALAATDTGVWVWNMETDEVTWNEQTERLFGLEPGSFAGTFEAFAERVHPDDLPGVQAAVETAVENDELYEKEFRIQRPHGEEVWGYARGEIFRDGDHDRMVGIMTNITERKEHERELQAAKDRLDLALAATDTGVWVWDMETDEVTWNESMERLFGLEPGTFEETFEAFAERVHPDDLPDVQAAIEAAVENDEMYESEYRIQRDDGEQIWGYARGEIFSDGDHDRMIGIVTDITERKETQQQYQRLTERISSGFYALDTDWNFTYWNDVVEQRQNVPAEEVLGENIWDLYPEIEGTVVGETLREAMESGEETSCEFYYGEMDYWVELQVYPDENGISVLSTEITDRKKRQQALERNREFLEQTQEVANVGGWEVDLRDDTLEWTDEVYRIHGVDMDYEPSIEDGIEFYHPEDRDAIQEAFERATTEGEPYDLELRIVRPDDEVRWIRTLGEPWYEDGEIVGARGTFQDITERKEREEELRKSNERLEQFAYVASHDLQEPLRTISNYTGILAEDYADTLDEDAKRFIDTVVTGSERMQSMIDGLLDYSRVTTRGNEFEPVDAEKVVVDTVDDLQFMLDEHDGTVEIGDLPTVEADGDQLHQVFQNLVKNALEHSGDDPVAITIRASEEGNHYRFEVEDDGPGIAENQQDKIFRIFKSTEQYQTESQAKGLGLAICDNIVRRHGGDIWVESEPGDGARFVFTIDTDNSSAATSMNQQ